MSANFIHTDLKNILPFKKLDVVLQYILDANKPPFRRISEIQKQINFESDSKELIEILDKLVKDGYVKEDPDVNNGSRYLSTFEGRIFMAEHGGYIKMIENDYLKTIRDDQTENRKVKNELRLIRVTRLAGIAGLLLFLMEVVKFLYQILHQSHS